MNKVIKGTENPHLFLSRFRGKKICVGRGEVRQRECRKMKMKGIWKSLSYSYNLPSLKLVPKKKLKRNCLNKSISQMSTVEFEIRSSKQGFSDSM